MTPSAVAPGRKSRRIRTFMPQPFKHPTTGVYYLRRKVPEPLREALGRIEYKVSLKTRDPSEVKRLFAEALAVSEERFALARAQVEGAQVLGMKDMRILAARWFRTEQSAMEVGGTFAQWMIAQDPDDESSRPQSLREWLDVDPDFDIEAHVEVAARDALKKAGVPWPAKPEAKMQLRGCFREHLLNLSDLALARLRGDWITVPSLVKDELLASEQTKKATLQRPKGELLSTLFDRYKSNRISKDGNSRASQKSVDACRVNTEQFIQLMGDLSMSEITRDAVHRYRELVSLLPSKGIGLRTMSLEKQLEKGRAGLLPKISAPTVRNKVKFLSAVFSYGVRIGWLDENPIIAGGLSSDVVKVAARSAVAKNTRRDYSEDELQKIFSSPLFDGSGWTPPRADFGEAWLWLPLLMYYTGARREELAQLKAREVIVEPGKPPYLDIMTSTADGDTRGVKNDGSRRRIPLHPALIDRGFLRYVETVRRADGQLFPKLKPNPAGYYGASFGKRWASYLRDVVKLASTVPPAHGFRHTFKTLCRAANISEEVSDAITGHAGGNRVARGYGTMPLERMAKELERYPRA